MTGVERDGVIDMIQLIPCKGIGFSPIFFLFVCVSSLFLQDLLPSIWRNAIFILELKKMHSHELMALFACPTQLARLLTTAGTG